MDIYNDSFIEYLIKKKKDGKDIAFIVLLCAAGTVFSVAMFAVMFAMFMSGNGELSTPIGLLVIAAAWYAVYKFVSSRDVEFEYILTNSEMDIDKVMPKFGRKRLVSWDFKSIEICAAVDDAAHRYEYDNAPDKIYDCTGDKDYSDVYFVDFDSENEGKVRVLFQPTSKIIETARKYNMRKVFIK